MSTKQEILPHPPQSLERFCIYWYLTAGKINGMKELAESLTRKAGDEILDKKLEKMLDSEG